MTAEAAARIEVRPRRRLGGFMLLVAVLWAVSANYGNNLGFILTYLLAALGVTAMWQTRRQLAGLDCRPLPAEAVFAGDTALLPVEIVERQGLPRWGLSLEVAGAAPVTFPLAAGERKRLALRYPAGARGVYRPGPVTLTSAFPLGLFRTSRRVGADWRLWVYPRPADRTPPLQAARQAPAGEREFQGFREYRPGDPPRQIHWKGLAKGRGLLSKQFVDVGREGGRVFDWDALPPADTETRLGWLCRWLLDAEDGGDEYGLRLPHGSLPPGRGLSHLHAGLRLLARFPGGGHD